MLKIFLLIYLVLFYGLAFFWRSYRTWRATGVNPYRLTDQTGLAHFVSRIYSLVSVGVVVVILLFSLAPAAWYGYLAPISWLENGVITAVGAILLLLALIWVLIAQIHMGSSWRIGIDTENETALITDGLFRLSRNPIFLGMRVNLFGLFLVLPNALTLLLWLLGDVSIQIQVFLEEDHLRQQHGTAYEQYCTRTPRYFGLPKTRTPDTTYQ